MSPRRLPAVVGIAAAQLRHDRTRTALAVLGVTVAVLGTVLLVGTGLGVVETGHQQFDSAGRDLWVTGGPVQLTPGRPGGVSSSVYDAHDLAAELRAAEGVRTVGPLLFQTVYVSRDGEEFETIAAMGVPNSAGVSVSSGRGFDGDPHYANGTYTGPMTRELLIDRRTADLLGVAPGDRIHVGGTVATARATEFEIVGVSGTGTRFLGAPTVTLPLSELQELSGKTATDPATLIAVTTTDGTDPRAVATRLQETRPELDVRTNREQLRATLERQAVVLAGGVSLVLLAVVSGLALTLNVLLSMVYQQRPEYATLKALGASTSLIAGAVFTQAVVVGFLGTALGIGVAVPVTSGLNAIVAAVTGFEGVVRLTPRVFAVGAATAATMSLASGAIASRQLGGLDPIRVLRF